MSRPKLKETADIRRPVSWTEKEWKKINGGKPEGVPLATFIKAATLDKVDEMQGAVEVRNSPISVLGYIPGGPALEVKPLPDHTKATPPFAVRPECYALLVVGDSMEAQYGNSVPDGSYAVFCPDREAFYGSIVHAEWEEKGARVCTIKKYCPQADGSAVFEPLNKNHKPITRKKDNYKIQGVFLKAWKDEPASEDKE